MTKLDNVSMSPPKLLSLSTICRPSYKTMVALDIHMTAYYVRGRPQLSSFTSMIIPIIGGG